MNLVEKETIELLPCFPGIHQPQLENICLNFHTTPMTNWCPLIVDCKHNSNAIKDAFGTQTAMNFDNIYEQQHGKLWHERKKDGLKKQFRRRWSQPARCQAAD